MNFFKTDYLERQVDYSERRIKLWEIILNPIVLVETRYLGLENKDFPLHPVTE